METCPGSVATRSSHDAIAGYPDRSKPPSCALYAYTHVAHEGGFDLSRYPAIASWLDRVAAEPGHVSIEA